MTARGFGEDPGISSEITPAGQLRITKVHKEVPMPHDAEGLRTRLRVWGASWVYAASRYPGRPILMHISMEQVGQYLD